VGIKIEWIQQAPNSSVIGKVIYKYNEKNNPVEEIHYGKEGTVTETYTYNYDLDKKDNWIRQKKIQDGKLIAIKERDIDYY